MSLVDHNGRPISSEPATKKRGYVNNYYRGAEINRYRSALNWHTADVGTTLNKSVRRRLLGYARWMYVNSGVCRGAIGDLARYSVGNGLIPQSNSEHANQYELFFSQWAKVADVGGTFSFWQMQRLASQRMDVDGDLGFLFVKKDFPQLQIIESHNIEHDGFDVGDHDGVYASAAGRPTAYSVRDGENIRKISANDFHLVFEPDRVGQLRGVTSLAHATDHIRDVIELLDYEKVGVKMASAIGIAIQSASGSADDGMSLVESGYSAADTGNIPWDTFQAGMIPRLKPGESIESFASNKPSPTFQGFLGWILKEVSIGLGLPYEFLVDPAGQGTASRFILEKAQRRFEERQYCIKKFCDRVWSWVIASAIKRGDLPPSENFWSVRWQTPKKITVDAGREAKANLDALKYGNRTLSEDLGERGQDWQNVRDQIEREADDLLSRAKRLSDQHGVSLDTAVSLISQRTPNPTFNDESSSNQ